MLLSPLKAGGGLRLSAENSCQDPKIGVALDPAEMLFGEHPRGSYPTLHHVRVRPPRHVVRAELDATLGALDDVGSREGLTTLFGATE